MNRISFLLASLTCLGHGYRRRARLSDITSFAGMESSPRAIFGRSAVSGKLSPVLETDAVESSMEISKAWSPLAAFLLGDVFGATAAFQVAGSRPSLLGSRSWHQALTNSRDRDEIVMEADGALARAMSTSQPVIVHIFDPKPDQLETYAIDDVSSACRSSGASAVLCDQQLLKAFADEQKSALGNFPEPLPVILIIPLKQLIEEGAGAQRAQAAKKLGASALGIVYFAKDWPEPIALDDALRTATSAAQAEGLETLLLADFCTGGKEGSPAAADLLERVGATAALAAEAESESGANLLGSWTGSAEELQRLRDAGFNGLVLQNACRGDVAKGAKESSPSIAAMGVTYLVQNAKSKKSSEYSFATAVAEGGPKWNIENYFQRKPME